MQRYQYDDYTQRMYERYKQIKNILVPALANNLVRFNAVGFRHLLRKSKMRSHRELKHRLSLLPFASSIMENPDAVVTYRVTKNNYGKVVQYWGLDEQIKDKRLRVIIRQVGNGYKHFYSIMETHQKIPL